MRVRRKRRQEFSDQTKAQIYARDRATCCFSGANLWLIESPLRPGFQVDWVDHIKPASRGGGNQADNGVCASHLFNAKKRNNTADNAYLFAEGKPSWVHFYLFGPLSEEALSRLDRLSGLTPEDWFLNRAIGNILIGFNAICDQDRYDIERSRKASYWYNAAFKRIRRYQKRPPPTDLESRGLVDINNPQQQDWLRLRSISTLEDLNEIVTSILKGYQTNYDAWMACFEDELDEARIEELMEAPLVHEETRLSIRQHLSLRNIQP